MQQTTAYDERTMTPRRVGLLATLGLFAVLAIAPVFFLQNAADERQGDAAYQALAVYAKAHNGDQGATSQAAQALETLDRTELPDGSEQLTRLSDNGKTCWVLVVEDGTSAGPPRKGVRSDCN